jgi:putative spermidine/putrescine transport system permease protein
MLLAVAWATLAYLLLPLVVVIGVSFTTTAYLTFPPVGLTLDWYRKSLADPTYVEAFMLSVKLAVASTFVALLAGVPAALVLARSSFVGRGVIAQVFLSPLVLPNIIVGVAILQFASLLGFGRSIWWLLVGHVVLVIPYVMRTTMASLSGLNLSSEEAAQDLGATPMETFFLVTLPQIKPGVIAGALFAFIMSWINVEISIFQAKPDLMTLPVKLFNYVEYSVDPLLAAVSSVTIYFAIAVVLIIDVTVGIEKVTSR